MRKNSPKRSTQGAIDAKRRGDPGFVDFRIADSPFYLLARTTGRYSIDMENALRAIDMDLPSWRALMILSECNPSSVSEIADRAVMRLSTMTRVVQRLERRGLLKVKRRKGDARVTEVYINSKGLRAARQVRQIASRFYNLAFHDLDAAEIDSLNALLRKVFSNLALRPELVELDVLPTAVRAASTPGTYKRPTTMRRSRAAESSGV